MLARLEAARWLSSEWEQIDASKEGRPRRRFYNITGIGQLNTEKALAELQIGSPAGELAWNT